MLTYSINSVFCALQCHIWIRKKGFIVIVVVAVVHLLSIGLLPIGLLTIDVLAVGLLPIDLLAIGVSVIDVLSIDV